MRARTTLVAGFAVVVALLALYELTRPAFQVAYNHFAWQAQAWLEGSFSIRYPVPESATSPGNAYFNDVIPVVDAAGNATGRGMIPFPPLPAAVLLPFVAAFGLATDQTFLSILIGALDVAAAFWMLGRLRLRPAVHLLLTVFLGAGSALWYAASLGSTWYFAHVVAVGLALASVGIALDAADREAELDADAPRPVLDGRQVAAGLLLGLAATSRLPVAFGFPFLLLVGGGGRWWRRWASAGVGVAIPLLGLVAYNLAATGQAFNPAYEALYRYELLAWPDLGYNGAWSMEDVRYIPQNLGLMLFGLPTAMPACDAWVARTFWSTAGCSWLVPDQRGMSLLLSSPAYLLALPALGLLRDRRVLGALAATLAIATVNLMHFSQGWVQFGYRFSLDFAPFLLVAVALGTERLLRAHDAEPGAGGARTAGPDGASSGGAPRLGQAGGYLRQVSLPAAAPTRDRPIRRLALVGTLVGLSVAIQAWGIAWARTLYW